MSAFAQNFVYVTTKDVIEKLDKTALTREGLEKCQKTAAKYPIVKRGRQPIDIRQ